MDELNLVKNPRFALGKKTPRSWNWNADGRTTRWAHEPSVNGQADRVMLIESDRPERSAVWSQMIRCERDQHYRIEADVECDCGGADEASGLLLSVQAYADDAPIGAPLRFAPVRRASRRLTLRGYFKTPADAGRVEIRIGMVNASGWTRVYDVRLIANLELDAGSHVLAVPPPAYAERPPRTVRRLVVCGTAESRPSLVEILQLRFGPANVKVRPLGAPGVQRLRADAVLIPGDAPPAGLGSVRQLEALAHNRIVVISIRAFARLSGAPQETRTIAQLDDPMHAKVTCGCFITAGFALHDVFPFAGVGDEPTGFVQRQFVTNRAFGDFRKQRGFEVFLTAITDNDRTMDKPIGLFKRTADGVVVVFDLDALEAPPTTLAEVNAPAAMLLNMLGGPRHALGQFVRPAQNERDFRQELLELQMRYEPFECLGIDRSEESARNVAVRLGHDVAPFGLMPPQRPAVVIRTGLRTGDEDGIYGTMLWLKRLARPSPFACAYARYLTRRYRILWLPLHRPWNNAIGLALCDGTPRGADDAFDPERTRVVVDVTAGSQNRLRVVFGRGGAFFDRCARALPALARATDPNRFIVYAAGPGETIRDFDRRAWRHLEMIPEVAVDEASFAGPLPRSARESGADVVRIELPHSLTDLTADSLRRTDLAACTLEHVVGLACDTFVMNHLGHAIELDATDILGESCDKYTLVSTDPRTGEDRAERRRMKSAPVIRLAPGTAVCR